MKVRELLNESLSKKDTYSILLDFIRFAANGTITGALDNTKTYYRTRNTLNTAQLPTLDSGNTVVNNINTVNSVDGVLVAGRPWS